MTKDIDNIVQELVKAGAHIGHRPSFRHPRMKPFIFGVRGAVELIDVRKTAEALQKAKEFVEELAANHKIILFVGTKPQMQELTKNIARACDMPYVIRRWLGGTITNFAVVAKRLEAFRGLEKSIANQQEMEKYTKAEQLRLRRKYEHLEEEIGGLKELRKPPDALILASLHSEALPAKEARMRNIPTIAIVDSNTDPSLVDYPIPGNDDALSALNYIFSRLAEGITEGQKKQKTK
ncbi:MAG: 30S ribosomal protein S2 [Candidatus Terrybacteria bacterium RIFCSPHIGHO2_01_FULL_48_17]|uniref:Small ribosomal subunit protein uS2 n=1 Tax=Candidatus Terrybacteria bacterium RIFCSPHIGHO2_01_FULL_48_17 TaxID=1802362 RepID=A0A1G2PIK0_9BACT|nr:MAG: 30S ribosomal protein S2 [Candidatus Terrybacteria bacterium RIFCSPHIGHO2_01_FULL_48_17]OHA53861.1 MAG: 30S ribosomal protein S2 [Candidatus Terrybacteria bacterium RIFCSPLOWO2_01_FULL_48_14]